MSVDLALLDTNVLIYALDPRCQYYAASRALLDKAQEEGAGLCLLPQVLVEFYAIVTDARRVPKPRPAAEAIAVINQFVALPGVTLLPVPPDILERLADLLARHPVIGPGVFDVQIVAALLANDVRRLYTFDRAVFERFTEIEVLTPQGS